MSNQPQDYARALLSLLPPGSAWTRRLQSNMGKLMEAFGALLCEVEDRGADLREEADPRTTLEMLSDWERNLGLPDECDVPTDTIQERRVQVTAKFSGERGQSRQFFIDLAGDGGFTVTITEFHGSPGNEYKWQVNAGTTTVREFRCGQNACGDPLRVWGNELLECLISRAAPAHTRLVFAYS